MLIYGPCWPTIINVPADSATIQGGINGSSDGDTVLVQPGTYVENINFWDHNTNIAHDIVLGSLFLVTGDTSYISSTIIDGDSAGTVIIIESGQESTTVITGFTIQNGAGPYGGGISCYGSNPIIDFNIIRNNFSGQGGGINCYDYSPRISNNTIVGNISSGIGGGIFCELTSDPLIIGNTIVGNSADSGGGIGCDISNPTVLNTIIWDNNAQSGSGIHIYNSSPQITYCDIQDTLWPGEGNITCDPVFCFPDTGNFNLHLISCCLNAGQNGVHIGARGVGCGECDNYVIGDINNSGNYNGLDVVYGVAFLKGGPSPPYICECTSGNFWYASGDVNGSCNYNGLDITYGVSYLKGIQTELFPCPDCPPGE
jgi:parallel beta-helix repeat protein